MYKVILKTTKLKITSYGKMEFTSTPLPFFQNKKIKKQVDEKA